MVEKQSLSRPWWVKLTLWGLPNRFSALFFVWLCVGLAAAFVLLGFRDRRLSLVAALWLLPALGYFARSAGSTGTEAGDDRDISWGSVARYLKTVRLFFTSPVRSPAIRWSVALLGLLLTVNALNVVNSYVGRDFMTAVSDRRPRQFADLRRALRRRVRGLVDRGGLLSVLGRTAPAPLAGLADRHAHRSLPVEQRILPASGQ